MRSLLINYEYPRAGGGAATATQAMAQALLKLGHSVTVVTGRMATHRAISQKTESKSDE